MRINKSMFAAAFALAIPLFGLAQPAWAHHNTQHSIAQTPIAGLRRDPCATQNGPHVIPGLAAMADQCVRLRAAVRHDPQNAALKARCAHMARAQTGAPCPDMSA